jgi:hypothetical protein
MSRVASSMSAIIGRVSAIDRKHCALLIRAASNTSAIVIMRTTSEHPIIIPCEILLRISDEGGHYRTARLQGPLSSEAAYQVLENMGPRLDADLIREFRPFARAQVR